jgi:sigma-B regulation protein RsbU (phosphoserine phosphatase)
LKKKILIVEDDRVLLSGLRHHLEGAGYDVLAEGDGTKGLQEAKRKEPDLVILDVMLPGIDGFEICSQLKQGGFQSPIFLLTQLSDEHSRLDGLGFGADDYIPKPFSAKELVLRVRNALSQTDRVLGKAKSLDDELRKAREIQVRSLPGRAPKMTGLDVFGVSVPATHVGGDYFDYVKLEKRRLGVLIADVAGKGMAAALLVHKMQGIVQSTKSRETTSASILNKLQENLAATLPLELFVTAASMVFDLRLRQVQISNAGHVPVLLKRGGSIRTIKPNGIWVGPGSAGIFEKHLEMVNLDLKKNDVYFMFTDGALEAADGKGREFGLNRVRKMLASGQNNARKVVKKCLDEITKFSGSVSQADDITTVAVRIL